MLRCIYTSENFPRNGKFSADCMRSMSFYKEKIVLRMHSAENFPFRGKFSEVYMHLYVCLFIYFHPGRCLSVDGDLSSYDKLKHSLYVTMELLKRE